MAWLTYLDALLVECLGDALQLILDPMCRLVAVVVVA